MKNKLFLLAFFCSTLVQAQTASTKDDASFELGNGLNFSLEDSAYTFKLSGMVQPSYAYNWKQGVDEGDQYLSAKRTFFNVSGNAVKEKVSFLLQLDFSLPTPLLDAWIAYKPIKNLTLKMGQFQNISNNREMLQMEYNLSFAERSMLSTTFGKSGREFGLAAEYKLTAGGIGIVPQIMVSSGDGRNSFGVDSRDVDLGGYKYGARLDLYPLGYFSANNEGTTADLTHEISPKLQIGAAASYNDGASNAVGEGHGDFAMYNYLGGAQLPDYRKLYGDVLFKFKGFSLLGEYVVATATSLQGSYIDATAFNALVPTQISEYLALGRAYNAQVGYVTKKGYALDVRYSGISPEFANPFSVVEETNAYTVGFSKYFKGNSLKMQANFSAIDQAVSGKTYWAEVLFQLVF